MFGEKSPFEEARLRGIPGVLWPRLKFSFSLTGFSMHAGFQFSWAFSKSLSLHLSEPIFLQDTGRKKGFFCPEIPKLFLPPIPPFNQCRGFFLPSPEQVALTFHTRVLFDEALPNPILFKIGQKMKYTTRIQEMSTSVQCKCRRRLRPTKMVGPGFEACYRMFHVAVWKN